MADYKVKLRKYLKLSGPGAALDRPDKQVIAAAKFKPGRSPVFQSASVRGEVGTGAETLGRKTPTDARLSSCATVWESFAG
jgi:hypothetical protein